MKTSEQIDENICVALEKQTALQEQVKYQRIYICFRNFWLIKNGKSYLISTMMYSTGDFHLVQRWYVKTESTDGGIREKIIVYFTISN